MITTLYNIYGLKIDNVPEKSLVHLTLGSVRCSMSTDQTKILIERLNTAVKDNDNKIGRLGPQFTLR